MPGKQKKKLMREWKQLYEVIEVKRTSLGNENNRYWNFLKYSFISTKLRVQRS